MLTPKKIHHITKSREKKGILSTIKRFFTCLMLSFSYLIWGHGEYPSRTICAGLIIILFSSFIYTGGYLLNDGEIFKPQFFEALYFSVITFTTVGFGDITASGVMRLVVMVESFCGIFIVPLFIIGLTRKYLRIF